MSANQLHITNPLRQWRQAQTVPDPQADGGVRVMRVTDAARLFGTSHPVWRAWEQDFDNPEFKLPSRDNMQKLYAFTGGAVTADMMNGIAPFRRAAA